MNAKLTARTPLQDRSRQRVRAILKEAESLLVDGGVTAFSIPILAEKLGYPRATVYKFFPTPFSLLNSLAEQHLRALEKDLYKKVTTFAKKENWRVVTRHMVEAAADYYRANPVACILLLSSPITDESYRSLGYTINRLGTLTQNMLKHAGLLMAENPCEAALAVEFGTASLRLSYFLHQAITPEYVDAASDAMISFIEIRQNRLLTS